MFKFKDKVYERVQDTYIGRTVVVKPEAAPTSNRPKTNSSTDEVIRHVWNEIDPSMKRNEQMKYDPRLVKCGILLSIKGRMRRRIMANKTQKVITVEV